MRGAVLIVAMALVGCATAPPAPEKKAEAAPAPAQPGKKEVTVIGKGQPPIPGLRSTQQDTEFTIYHDKTYRCTKVKGSPENPKGEETCRELGSGRGGDPDTGLIDRGSNNIRR